MPYTYGSVIECLRRTNYKTAIRIHSTETYPDFQPSYPHCSPENLDVHTH